MQRERTPNSVFKIIQKKAVSNLIRKCVYSCWSLQGELLGVERHRLGSLTHQNLNVKGK